MRKLPFLLMLILVLSGCRTTRQAQMEYVYVNTSDTIHDIRIKTDSIHIIDSVVTFIKGDTVRIDRWHTTLRDRLRVDTVNRYITKTEYRTKTQTRVVEVNRLYWWQATLMWLGVVFMVFISGFLLKLIRNKGLVVI